MDEPLDEQFAVWAESQHPKPLIQFSLPFARLIDDIVYPYQSKLSFFIDGVPMSAKDIHRIKILQLKATFQRAYKLFRQELTRGTPGIQKLYGEQYFIRLEDILRKHSDDVTAQVIKAFDSGIKPGIKNYLPEKKTLIDAATQIFIASMKQLS